MSRPPPDPAFWTRIVHQLQSKRWVRLWIFPLVVQLVANVVFISLERGPFENSWIFIKLRSLGFDWSINSVDQRDRTIEDAAPPLVIVDISRMPRVDFEGNAQGTGFRSTEDFTSRQELLKIARALAEKYDVAGIGIDVDFSPDYSIRGGRTPAGQEDLLEYALALSETATLPDHINQPVPIYFGVGRGTASGKTMDWLGNPDFADLAATLVLLTDSPRDTPIIYSRAPTIVRAPSPEEADQAPLRGLAAALAGVYREQLGIPLNTPVPPFLAPFVEDQHDLSLVDQSGRPLIGRSFYLNYQQTHLLAYGMIDAEWITTATLEQEHLLRSQLQGKLVLLGNADEQATGDQLVMLGHRNPVPGVFAHGCAILTLLESPISRLTFISEVTLGILLSLFANAAVAGARQFIPRLDASLHVNARNQVLELLATLILVFLVSGAIGHRWNILWLGAISTAVGSCVETCCLLCLPLTDASPEPSITPDPNSN